MQFNTDYNLWKTAGTKQHYGTVRIAPTGSVYFDTSEEVARFSHHENAINAFQSAGWTVKDDETLKGWKEATA